MKLNQIEYFLVLAEDLHFGRAAERLHRSQPPLSRQIRPLEEELGVELLARNARRVSLTDAGRAFLHEIRPVLARVRQARKGDQVQALKDRRLSVGFVRSLTQDDELAHALVLEEPLLEHHPIRWNHLIG